MPEAIANLHEIERICAIDGARRDRMMMRLLRRGLDAEIDLNRLNRILPVHRILSTKRGLRTVSSGLQAVTRIAREARFRRA